MESSGPRNGSSVHRMPSSQAESSTPATSAPIVFTTQGLPASQRLEAWNDAFGTLNTITVKDSLATPILARTENWQLGGMVLSLTRVPASRFVRQALQARRDSLDHWVLRVLRSGSSRVQHPGFTATVGPGQPLLFSMHETWATDWEPAEWVSLCISRDLHPQLSANLGALQPGLLRGACAGLLADLLMALPDRLAAARPDEIGALADATRAAVAACLLAGPTAPGAALAGCADPQKERVRKAIHRHIGSARLTPARLAAASGLSRSALYRMFAEEGGVACYVRDIRLRLAHAALRDPKQAGMSIAEVAEAHGFHDPSAFSRAFRQAFGATPGEVRGQGLPGPAPPRAQPHRTTARGARDYVARIYGAG